MDFASRMMIVLMAVLLTVMNAIKPVVVDDTAYLLFARHVAAHPLDPYGFELFWYERPEPAMKILAPPVLPYWMGAGIAIFGESVTLLKLWLFPIYLLLSAAVWDLLRRFARGTELAGMILILGSAGIMPMGNFMLEIPALALGLVSIALYLRAVDAKSIGLAIVAGLVGALANQTKYSMLPLPVVFLCAGWIYGAHRVSIVAIVSLLLGFAGWELALVARYGGESHFAVHALAKTSSSEPLMDRLQFKWDLGTRLIEYLGFMAVTTGLYVGRAVGFPRDFVRVIGVVTVLGILAVVFVPIEYSVLRRDQISGSIRLDLSRIVFPVLGTATLVSLSVVILFTIFRARYPLRLRYQRDGLFLVGWLLIEVAAYYVLTPFPAARRLCPLCVIMGLLACRWVSRTVRIAGFPRRPERWTVALAVVLGVGLQVFDSYDASAERDLARLSTGWTGSRAPSEQVWTEGHWGWQYYCDRLGYRMLVTGESELKKGDYLVYPKVPDDYGFYRPYHGGNPLEIDETALEPVGELVWNDAIPSQTIPNLYGGGIPIAPRLHPRLRVIVYRVTRDWVPQPQSQRR